MSDEVSDAVPSNLIDRPYPLRSNFRRRILPPLVLLLFLIPALSGWGGAQLVETVYLQMAERRAKVIDRGVASEADAAWRRLKSSTKPRAVYDLPGGDELMRALLTEVEELSLTHLKVYGAGGVILFDTVPERIGTLDPSPAFLAAMRYGERNAVYKTLDDGTPLYELYVRLEGEGRQAPVVFELYEPTTHLDTLLVRAATPVALATALFLIAIVWALSRLVARAQRDIDHRTTLLAELRARIEGLVSTHAVQAARESLGSDAIRSEKVALTVFYSDVRGFTSFSEGVEPEAVVAFLNRIMGLQIEILTGEGGDVDKMIGDALLVRFEGEGREARALNAALEIQEALARAPMARGLGIGVFSGPAISGVVGPPGRQDYTVIGDSVNAVARLCTLARAGEVVADEDTVTRAGCGGFGGFGAVEEATVRGKTQALRVRRWRRQAQASRGG